MQKTNEDLTANIEEEKILKQKDFQLISTTLYHVDLNANNVIPATDKLKGHDISNYIEGLIDSILTKGDKRSFKFPPRKTFLKTAVDKVISDKNNHELESKDIAEKLLATEIKAQKKIQHLDKEIRKGSLIQVVLKRYGKYNYLILKVEHDAFYELSNLIRQLGLPEKKSVIKSCLIKCDESSRITSLILTDANSKISTYWWEDFLELEKVRKDEDNTKLVFKEVDKLLVKYVKQDDAKAYRVLKDAQIRYFKEKDTLNYSEFKDTVFTSFIPFNPNLDYNKFLKKLDELGKSNKFDTSFVIKASEIEKEFQSTYRVSNNVSISVNEGVPEDTIIAYCEDDEKFLRIRLEDELTYRQFKK